MRRLTRLSLTLCCALSLGLCIAVCVVWARDDPETREYAFARAGGPLWVFATTSDGILFKTVWPWPYNELGRRPGGVRGELSWEESFFPASDGYRDWGGGPIAWAQGRVMALEWPDGKAASVADYWDDYQELSFDAGKPGLQLLSLRVRHWLLACIFGAWPAAWLIRRCTKRAARARRQRRALCAACGYDLRASPERCPECGRPAKRA